MNKYIEKIERFFLKRTRRMLYRHQSLPKVNEVLLSNNELNRCIERGLENSDPFMVCRFGSTEFENFTYTYAMRQTLLQRYIWYIKGWLPIIHTSIAYEEELIERLCICSGFFPKEAKRLSKYTDLVLSDMLMIDILGVWRQENIYKDLLQNVQTGAMDALEPYDYAHPWSRALAGKRVLVVHPFTETIKAQYQKREYLWQNPEVLPEFELHTIKAVQSIAGEETPFKDWFEALHYMEQQMDAVDYDIAIIGCGAYGFHLAAHAKRMGKKAVHLGGATQILFGVKGKCWDDMPAVNKFYNEYWVYPSAEETPKHKERVEDGCYW